MNVQGLETKQFYDLPSPVVSGYTPLSLSTWFFMCVLSFVCFLEAATLRPTLWLELNLAVGGALENDIT